MSDLPNSYWLFAGGLVCLGWFGQMDAWSSKGARGAVRNRMKGVLQRVVESIAQIALTSFLVLPFLIVPWWLAIATWIVLALGSAFVLGGIANWLRSHPPRGGDFIDLYSGIAPWLGFLGAAIAGITWYEVAFEKHWVS